VAQPPNLIRGSIARERRLVEVARPPRYHRLVLPPVTPQLPGNREGLVLKDRSSPYRDGWRAGWWKVKDRSRYERESRRFDRR
jgi:hypothetical protein